MRQTSKLNEEQRQNMLLHDFGQVSAFKQLTLFHRLSRLGTVVVPESNTSIVLPDDILNNKRQISLKKRSITTVEEEIINYNIYPWVGWLILFLTTFFNALGPAWMAWDFKSESFTRNSWRFLVQTFLLTPFYNYQKRTSPPGPLKQMWKLENLLIIFKNALQYVTYYFVFILSSKFTSVNHAIYLSNTMIFWQLMFRFYNHYTAKKNQQFHQFEKAGAGMVIISIFLFFAGSLTDPVIQHPSSNIAYLGRPRLLRLLGDFIGFFAAYLLVYMQNNFKLLGNLPTPPLQTSLCYNGFIALILSAFGYFCGGSQISFNPLYGMFGLFTIQNFVRIFYVSILLGLGFLITNVFTHIIFPAAIMGISLVMEPLISSCLLHLFSSESIPSGFTCIGFGFMIPGLLMILAGRNAVLNVPMKFNFSLAIMKNQ